jgi:hypothetical protein
MVEHGISTFRLHVFNLQGSKEKKIPTTCSTNPTIHYQTKIILIVIFTDCWYLKRGSQSYHSRQADDMKFLSAELKLQQTSSTVELSVQGGPILDENSDGLVVNHGDLYPQS